MPYACFVLLNNPYDRELDIRIYPDLIHAERARSMCFEAEIIRIMVQDRTMFFDHDQPLHIAFTIEDDGLRIHGAFTSLLGLNTYLLSHNYETPCRTAIAWPGATGYGQRSATGG